MAAAANPGNDIFLRVVIALPLLPAAYLALRDRSGVPEVGGPVGDELLLRAAAVTSAAGHKAPVACLPAGRSQGRCIQSGQLHRQVSDLQRLQVDHGWELV